MTQHFVDPDLSNRDHSLVQYRGHMSGESGPKAWTNGTLNLRPDLCNSFSPLYFTFQF